MEKYNGWTNRETWAVTLHWTNNEADDNFIRANAKKFKSSGKNAFAFSQFLAATADEIFHAVIHEANVSSEEAKIFVEDVGSLWRVNWLEIAETYYNEVEE